MKLMVQIPCYNEAETIAAVVADIPRQLEGISEVIVVVIDDGSHDGSADLAKAAGVDRIVTHSRNRGLAEVFRTGLKTAIDLKADLLVNVDGDGQYHGSDIQALIAPVLEERADMVIGNRQVEKMASYTPLKRGLHTIGRKVVNRLGGIRISDPVSGFRALNKEAIFLLNVLSSFSYTTETLIQAGHHKLRITEVPVSTNPTERPSRLFRSIPHFVTRTAFTILRTYAMYQPLKVFSLISLLLCAIGMIPIIRFLLFYFAGEGDGHIQSLVLGSTFIVLGVMAMMFAILADVQARNRKLLEQVMEQVQAIRLQERPPLT